MTKTMDDLTRSQQMEIARNRGAFQGKLDELLVSWDRSKTMLDEQIAKYREADDYEGKQGEAEKLVLILTISLMMGMGDGLRSLALQLGGAEKDGAILHVDDERLSSVDPSAGKEL